MAVPATTGSTNVEIAVETEDQLSLYKEAGAVFNAIPHVGSGSSNTKHGAYTPGTWGRILEIIPR